MLNLAKHLPFVKQQAEFHVNMASRFGAESKYPDLKRSDKHTETAKQFQELIADVEEAEKLLDRVPARPVKQVQLSLSFDELEGLPEELLQELSISGGDRTDYTILRILEELGGIASLDRIIIGLFKQTGEVNKRSTITSRLYRMSQKGLIFPVPNKKGAYATQELTEEEVADILN
jgi:hypothetical protein